MPDKTALIARGVDPEGALYQRRAAEALPLLVRQAHAGHTIHYGELAAEMGMPNARNLNFVLGAVGTSLVALGERWGRQIPPLQALVINRAEGIPGTGFVGSLVDPKVLQGATARTRRQIIDAMLADVFTFSEWDRVLVELGQQPVRSDGELLRRAATWRGGGESEAHLALKRFVAANPAAVGMQARVERVEQEHRLPSGDEIDVLFHTRRGVVAVEVKSDRSPEDDVARGIFQCVKYGALLEAVAAADGERRDVRVVLALGGALTPATRRLANTLGIEVLERVGRQPPSSA